MYICSVKTSFNSTLVQLKGGYWNTTTTRMESFNSTLVQLKVVQKHLISLSL